MRSDMAKVIVERPRFGSRTRGKPKGYQRRLRRLFDEGPPAREGIKRRCQGARHKMFNEHLGPLRRYLDSQVGRSWDKVFSEICAHIDRSSAVQDHVRDHVEQYVARNVLLRDGVPCSGESGRGYGQPLHSCFRWRRWYVCPRTGILRRVERPRTKPEDAKPKSQTIIIRVGETLQCRRADGIWYLVTLKRFPPEPSLCRARDVVLDRAVKNLTVDEVRKAHGAAVFAAGMRRLGRKELGQLPIPRDIW